MTQARWPSLQFLKGVAVKRDAVQLVYGGGVLPRTLLFGDAPGEHQVAALELLRGAVREMEAGR